MAINYGQLSGYCPLSRGHFIVWVLSTPKGTEFIVGERAVPPPEMLQYVIARIGPIGYEEGQGLERFKDELERDIETIRSREDQRLERESIRQMVIREIESRRPSDPKDGCAPETDGAFT